MYVYVLESTMGRTYVGATINLDRRLRQHNSEISGGAKATRGQTWTRIAYVSGFPTWSECLKFEWRLKKLSRSEKGTPLERRINGLHKLLSLDKSTSSAIPFSEWPTLPQVHWEENKKSEKDM